MCNNETMQQRAEMLKDMIVKELSKYKFAFDGKPCNEVVNVDILSVTPTGFSIVATADKDHRVGDVRQYVQAVDEYIRKTNEYVWVCPHVIGRKAALMIHN